MARKKYDNKVKSKAIKLHQDGRGVSAIAKELDIPVSTVGTWIQNNKPIPNTLNTKEIASNSSIKEFSGVSVSKEIVEEVINNKDDEIQRLRNEVSRLDSLVEFIKKEAGKEINTLKDAIIILAKSYEE